MNPELRSALHVVVYIRELGAEPPPLKEFKWQKWAKSVHQQFDRLQKARGARARKAACLRGRSLIAEKGLMAAAADSLPLPRFGERFRCLFCNKWTWSTLDEAFIALARLKQAPDVRKGGMLGVYRCPRGPDSGWHLGHDYFRPAEPLCIGEHR